MNKIDKEGCGRWFLNPLNKPEHLVVGKKVTTEKSILSVVSTVSIIFDKAGSEKFQIKTFKLKAVCES